MLYLKDVSITFNTHNDDKNPATVVHVFVKNRRNNSQTPEQNSDFISNWLAYQRYSDTGDLNDGDSNPYLAYGLNLSGAENATSELPGLGFPDPSTFTFPLNLRSATISVDEIVLPAVNIHILTNGDDRWIFDYTIKFTFHDPSSESTAADPSFSCSSNVDGIRGIILDQDNRNYSGICSENTLRTLPFPALPRPVTDSVLKKVTLEFATHNDNKNADTRLNVHIVNRLSPASNQDIAIGLDLFHGEEFPDAGPSPLSYKEYTWSSDDGTLSSNSIRLADMVLPVVSIIIVPSGDDRWIFDYQVTFEFGDPQDFNQKNSIYRSRTNGIILDQDNNKYSGVYQGRPFPTVAPPTAPQLVSRPVDHTNGRSKQIPVAFLKRKFDEFINSRNGADDSGGPPLDRIRLHNSGVYNPVVLPESYFDRRAVTALNKHGAAGQPTVAYVSNPTSVGQLQHFIGSLYLNDINSSALTLSVDPAQEPTPLTFSIEFDCSGSQETIGGVGGMNFLRFSISVLMTLDLARTTTQSGAQQTVIDVMSWASDIQRLTRQSLGGEPETIHYTGTILGQSVDVKSSESIGNLFVERFIKVALATEHSYDPGGTFRQAVRDEIFSTLTTPDIITKKTPLDGINSMVTSWLLGGVADDTQNTDDNNAVISGVGIVNDSIVISYTGARNLFVEEPPANWPAAGKPSTTYDFSPGNLSNIDHIVVLMMENRSFDHMMGYLSLPTAQGGMARSDVDGLKGGEVNTYNGIPYASYALTDTLFTPDPPHGHEPVTHAIDGGLMDGFVLSYATAHSDEVAAQIMGHQTGATVPAYDALARDFALGHRWFASHPGPTFCNRFYTLTGRLNLDPRGFWEFDNSNPLLPVFTPTIFDYLTGATDPATGQPVTWAYFEHGYCFLRFFEGHTFDNQENIFTADDPEFGFFARASAANLPSVSFIDPHFVEYPPGAFCDGPPSDVAAGQDFARKVVEAVIAGPAWNKTMLILTYDEHGGFYDHVPPPAGAKASPDFPIETLGVRVPTFVISPWVGAQTVFGYGGIETTPVGPAEPGAVAGQAQPEAAGQAQPEAVHPITGLHFDHTSIMKTIARRFMSTSPPYLGARYAAAHDLSSVIGNQLRQPQFLPFIRYNIQFAASQMMLDVQGAVAAPGTLLWQFGANGTIAQDYSFEDAGDGFVYIRSHVSNLYVTVNETHDVQLQGAGATQQAPAPAPAAAPAAKAGHVLPVTAAEQLAVAAGAAGAGHEPGGSVAGAASLAGAASAESEAAAAGNVAAAGAGSTSATAAGPVLPGIIQEAKYSSRGLATNLGLREPRPELQKWQLSRVGITVFDRDRFMISNQAYPGQVLQPADPAQSGSMIVLGDVGPTIGLHAGQNSWLVTTPLINNEVTSTLGGEIGTTKRDSPPEPSAS